MSEWFEILFIENYTLKECSNALLSQQQNNNVNNIDNGWKIGNKSSRSPCPYDTKVTNPPRKKTNKELSIS